MKKILRSTVVTMLMISMLICNAYAAGSSVTLVFGPTSTGVVNNTSDRVIITPVYTTFVGDTGYQCYVKFTSQSGASNAVKVFSKIHVNSVHYATAEIGIGERAGRCHPSSPSSAYSLVSFSRNYNYSVPTRAVIETCFDFS